MNEKSKLTLYHIAPSRSSIVHWMLEEIGEPFDLHVLDHKNGENRKEEYLAINPMGKVPALRHGDVIITEAAAICCYLGDAFPEAKLAPSIGDPRRGPYLKWLFFAPSCLEPAMFDRIYKRETEAPIGGLGWGNFDMVMNVVTNAVKTGPFLLGEQFTAADVVLGSGLRWGLMMKNIPENPEILAYTARVSERPALQRATKKDQELASMTK